MRATVEGSFIATITPDSGIAFTASGTRSVSITIPISGSTGFVLHATRANLESDRFTWKARVKSSAKGWVIDGVDISDGDEHTIAPAESFDASTRHALLTPAGSFGPASITFLLSII